MLIKKKGGGVDCCDFTTQLLNKTLMNLCYHFYLTGEILPKLVNLTVIIKNNLPIRVLFVYC